MSRDGEMLTVELPTGWGAANLGEVVARDGIFTDGDWVESKDQDPKGDVRLVQLADIGDGEYRNRSARYLTSAKAHELRCTFLAPGDVLVARMPEPLGRACIFPGDRKASVTAVDVCIIRPGRNAVDPRWLTAFINTPQFRSSMGEYERGTTRKRISRANLAQLPLPVPPLPEQHRIVERVEVLLARVNAASDRLAKVPTILKRFRESVLTAACTGRLTEDWRETHRKIVPMGGTLQARRAVARGKARGKAHHELDTSALPEIPETWGWARLPELGELNRGKSRHRPRNDPRLLGGKYPFIQTGDIARSGGKITAHSQTYNETGLAQSRLWPAKTVCITIAANIAESALLTYPACFPDSVVGLVADPSLCVAEYAEFFVRTARDDLSQYAPATAQKNINLEILRDLAVALPPVEEQAEIVRRVEALFGLAAVIEQRVGAAMARADRMTQAILAKAFRGELVPTEAELARQEGREYEPASVLLGRIKAERAVNTEVPTAARKRRAAAVSKSIAKSPTRRRASR